LFVKAIVTGEPLTLVGFPAQWIPACVHYGVSLVAPRQPLRYLPLFSDLPAVEIEQLARSAMSNQASRSLLEAAAALDPVIADFIYIVDHKLFVSGRADPAASGTVSLLNTWHSFCRPEVISIQEQMARSVVDHDTVLLLPCSRHRPYNASRTHARLFQQLAATGHNPANAAHVVVTALGVVPRSYWDHQQVMSYDAGAVDLWRVFSLLQVFFATNRFATVLDCLSFRPFSDMLSVLNRMAVIGKPTRPLKLRWRGFHVKLP
jgi:hypothetical protein